MQTQILIGPRLGFFLYFYVFGEKNHKRLNTFFLAILQNCFGFSFSREFPIRLNASLHRWVRSSHSIRNRQADIRRVELPYLCLLYYYIHTTRTQYSQSELVLLYYDIVFLLSTQFTRSLALTSYVCIQPAKPLGPQSEYSGMVFSLPPLPTHTLTYNSW